MTERKAIFAEDKTLTQGDLGHTLASQYDGQIVTVTSDAYDGVEAVLGFKLPPLPGIPSMMGHDVTFADGTEGWVFADELIFEVEA